MKLDLDKAVHINDNGYHYCYHAEEKLTNRFFYTIYYYPSSSLIVGGIDFDSVHSLIFCLTN